MTFIATINRCGSTAIFADSMLTVGGVDVDFRSIKNGILLPGSIYGVSGDYDEAMRFVLRCREEADGNRDAAENWSVINRVVDGLFTPKPNREFFIDLSTRHSGKIEHYSFDGRHPKLESMPTCFGRGSGGVVLNALVETIINTMLSEDKIEQFSKSNAGFSVQDWPYMMAFWLHQNSFGHRQYELQKASVGGVFHFVRQTPTSEHRQDIAMYILAGKLPGASHPRLIKYRYAFEEEQLLAYSKPFGGKGMWSLLCMDVSIDMDKKQEELDQLIEKHKAGPPYHFLTAGMWDWEDKPMTIFIDAFDGEFIDADLEDYLDPNLNDLLLNLAYDNIDDWMQQARAKFDGGPVFLALKTPRRQWHGPKT